MSRKRTLDPRPIYYVYVLFDWCGTPRYVGKGTGNRWLHHERKTDVINILKNIFIEQTWIMLGEIPKIKIRENLTNEDAILTEITLIKAIGRADQQSGPLTNMTDGGDGISGYIHSQEAKHKISIAKIGHIPSLETRQLMSIARTGRKHSEESKYRMSLSKKGQQKTKEHRQNISKGLTGYKHSEDAKQNMSNSKKGNHYSLGRTHSEETKLKIGNAGKGRTHTKETKQQISNSHKGLTHSEKTKHELSILATGTRWITDGKMNKRIRPGVTPSEGWIYGRTVSKRRSAK
jgi:hypothetical protein